MPNHETNTVVITGTPAKIEKFIAEGLRDYEGDNSLHTEVTPEKVIDFSLIVPPPENIEEGGCPHLGIRSDLNADGTYLDNAGNLRTCWYEWNIANWGTKWGAYSHSHYSLRHLRHWETGEVYARVDLRFETAWSQPKPIFEAIERRWGVTVHAVTLDEGSAPDVEYGDPYGEDVIHRQVIHEFTTWEKEVQLADA